MLGHAIDPTNPAGSLLSIIEGLRRRASLSALEVDALAGLADGHTGKIERALVSIYHGEDQPSWARTPSFFTIVLILASLHYRLVAVPIRQAPPQRLMREMAARAKIKPVARLANGPKRQRTRALPPPEPTRPQQLELPLEVGRPAA